MKKSKLIWTITRISAFVLIGLMNTMFIRPDDSGSWQNYLGYGFLVMATVEVILILRNSKVQRR